METTTTRNVKEMKFSDKELEELSKIAQRKLLERFPERTEVHIWAEYKDGVLHWTLSEFDFLEEEDTMNLEIDIITNSAYIEMLKRIIEKKNAERDRPLSAIQENTNQSSQS